MHGAFVLKDKDGVHKKSDHPDATRMVSAFNNYLVTIKNNSRYEFILYWTNTSGGRARARSMAKSPSKIPHAGKSLLYKSCHAQYAASAGQPG